MTYARCTAGSWYCVTPNGRLFRITNWAKVNRKARLKQLRRSRSVLRRLGYSTYGKA